VHVFPLELTGSARELSDRGSQASWTPLPCVRYSGEPDWTAFAGVDDEDKSFNKPDAEAARFGTVAIGNDW